MITVLAHGVRQMPVFLQMEFSIYDPIQRWFTIDNKDDFMHRKFSKELNTICGINIDNSCIDKSTNSVDKYKLNALLERLQEVPQVNSILLGYFLEKVESDSCGYENVDNVLIKNIRNLEDKLVLPYTIESEPVGVLDAIKSSHITVHENFLHETKHSGFIFPLDIGNDNTVRYHLLRVEESPNISAVCALSQLSGGLASDYLIKTIPNEFEVNYVLRNRASLGKDYALNIYDAKKIISWDTDKLNEYLSRKVIFIGRFEPMKNQLNRQIDGYKTPIEQNLNGIYFLINSYLNVSTKTYLSRAQHWFVWIVNFALAFFGISYHNKAKKRELKSVSKVAWEVVMTIFIFLFFLTGLYFWFQIKFPFVISCLAFLKLTYWKKKFDIQITRFTTPKYKALTF